MAEGAERFRGLWEYCRERERGKTRCLLCLVSLLTRKPRCFTAIPRFGCSLLLCVSFHC